MSAYIVALARSLRRTLKFVIPTLIATTGTAFAFTYDFGFGIAPTSSNSFQVTVTNVGPSPLDFPWRYRYKIHIQGTVVLSWVGNSGGSCTPPTPVVAPAQVDCTLVVPGTLWIPPAAYTKTFTTTGHGTICLHDGKVDKHWNAPWVQVPETNYANNDPTPGLCITV